MNISQSTYSNNSRFVSNHKDPLEKYKLGLKERFKQTYDQIEEQKFIQPYQPPDGTILLTEQQSLRSFLNSTQKIADFVQYEEGYVSYQKPEEIQSVQVEQQSMTTRKTKHKIFEPLPFQIPLFKSLVTTSQTPIFTKQLLQEKNCQTSFVVEKVNKSNQIIESIQIPRPKSSIGIQVNQNNEPILRETVSVQCSARQSCNTSLNVQSYIDRHYDYQQLEPHSNWKPCFSEIKIMNSHFFDEYNYSFCDHCNQFIKKMDNDDSFHQNKCQYLKLENTFQEMIGKFSYLLSQETNQLRDFDESCIKMRKCCFATQEICILLQNTNCEKRQGQLKQDIKKIYKEIQKLKDNHSQKIHQLFQKLIVQL